MISFIVLISPGNKTAVKDDFSLHQGAGCQGRNSPSTGLGGGKKENRAGEGKRRESFPSIGWSHLKEVKLECKSWCLRALAGEKWCHLGSHRLGGGQMGGGEGFPCCSSDRRWWQLEAKANLQGAGS